MGWQDLAEVRYRTPGGWVLKRAPDGSWVQAQPEEGEDPAGYTYMDSDAMADVAADPYGLGGQRPSSVPDLNDPYGDKRAAAQRAASQPAPSGSSGGLFAPLGMIREMSQVAIKPPVKAQKAAPPIPTDIPVREPDGAEAPVASAPEAPAAPPPPMIPSTLAEDGNVYREHARPLMEQMLAARQQSDMTRAGAMISRGGAQIGAAISGTKVDDSAAKALEESAALPEQRVMQDFQLEQVVERMRQQKELTDPASPVNRRVQDAFLATPIGRQMGEGVVRRLTAPEIEKMGAMGKAAAEMALREEGLGIDKARLEETERHNRVMENRPVSNRYGGIDRRAVDNHILRLGRDTAKFAPVVEGFKQLDALVPGFSDGVIQNPADFDLSPADRAALALPAGIGSRMVSPKAAKLQTTLKNFQDLIQRVRSGAVLNESEIENYQKLFHNQIFSDPRAAAGTVAMMKAAIVRQIRDAQVGYETVDLDPEDPSAGSVLDEFERRNGTSYRTLERPAAVTSQKPLQNVAPPPVPQKKPRYEKDANGQWYEVIE